MVILLTLIKLKQDILTFTLASQCIGVPPLLFSLGAEKYGFSEKFSLKLSKSSDIPKSPVVKDKGIPHHFSRAFLYLAGTQSEGGLAKNLSSGFCTPKRGITKFG